MANILLTSSSNQIIASKIASTWNHYNKIGCWSRYNKYPSSGIYLIQFKIRRAVMASYLCFWPLIFRMYRGAMIGTSDSQRRQRSIRRVTSAIYQCVMTHDAPRQMAALPGEKLENNFRQVMPIFIFDYIYRQFY